MGRTISCLGLGVALWTLLGAVRGATYWQVSANGYLGGLVVVGMLLGFLWPGPHLRTGVLLVVPGAMTLVAARTGEHPDAGWWVLTMVIGVYAAAGSHWLAAEVRRRLRHKAALPPGSQNR